MGSTPHWAISALILGACSTQVPVLDGADGGGTDVGVGSDGGLDGGGPDAAAFDAPIGTDAGASTDHYFQTVPATTDFWVTFERCVAREDASTVLSVTMHWFSSCHTPGPISASVDEPTRAITVSGTLWEEVGGDTECMPVGAAITRDVALPPLSTGRWTVNDDFQIDVTAGAACNPSSASLGDPCVADCDCIEGVCLANVGAATCASSCQIPCFVDLDCGRDRRCVPDATTGSRCEGRTVDSCVGGDCRDGMRCQMGAAARECVWDINLRGTTRTPCATASDCTPGHDCVEAGGERHCEVRCSTENMLCPGSARCVRQAVETPARWVCETP